MLGLVSTPLKFSFTLLVSSLFFYAGGVSAGERVAVLELATPGLEARHGAALSANLISIVGAEVKRLGYDVITAADVDSMLSLERKKDLVGCEDTSCLAEIGGALGVDLLISGNIGKLGDTFNVSLVLLDIKKATVRERFTTTAGSESLLGGAVTRGVGVLFGSERMTGGSGTLLVRTNPPGGQVFVDDKLAGTEPVTIDDLAAGEHTVRGEAPGLLGKSVAKVQPDQVTRLTVELTATRQVRMKVFSTPPDASVFVDGRDVGRTPVVVPDLAAGPHSVTLELEGYLTATTHVDLSADDFERSGGVPQKLEVALQRRLILLPVQLGVAVGSYIDASRASAGLTGNVELSVLPLDQLEFALGLTRPSAATIQVRWFIVHGAIEVGPVARFAVFRRQFDGELRPALGVGLTVDYVMPTRLGDFGVRLESTVSRNLDDHLWTFPALASLLWRA